MDESIPDVLKRPISINRKRVNWGYSLTWTLNNPDKDNTSSGNSSVGVSFDEIPEKRDGMCDTNATSHQNNSAVTPKTVNLAYLKILIDDTAGT